MREVLYTKYNSVRKPEYQISTSIFVENDTKYVEKKAIQKSALAHVENIAKNAEKIKAVYKDIQVLSGECEDGKIVFPFLEGKSLLDDIDVKNEELDCIVEKLKKVLKKIHNYSSKYVDTFYMTESFENFFKGCNPEEEPAVILANIDGIFGNFIEKEDGSIWCIDCEWVLDFYVPIRYIEYRSLLYFYVENYTYLRKRAEEKQFISMFGFSDKDMELFSAMEEAFQQRVHGENRKYIYVDNYKKPTTTFFTLLEQLDIAQKKVESMALMIDEQHQYIQQTHRALRNPLYGLQLMGKKIKNKIVDKD